MHNARKRECCVKRTQIVVKTKTFTILTTNETDHSKNSSFETTHIYLDRQLGKIKSLLKKQFILPRSKSSRKNSKMALLRETTKTKVLVFVCFDSFVIALSMEIILRAFRKLLGNIFGNFLEFWQLLEFSATLSFFSEKRFYIC